MLLAWQEDYPPIIDTGVVDQQVQSTSNTQQLNDLPTQVPSSSPSTNVPVTASTNISSESRVQSDLVHIKTDTLELSIDLRGGDIVNLSLPKYLKQIDVIDDPFTMLESSPRRDYIAQSGLIGQNGIDSSGRALYESISRYYELESNQNTLQVDLINSVQTGVNVTKRFIFTRDSYLVDIEFLIENDTDTDWQANAFGQIKRDSFEDPSSVGGLGRTFLGFVTTTSDDPYIKVDFDDIDDRSESSETLGGWIGFSQHYFLSAWIPNQDEVNRFTTRKNQANQYFGEFTSGAFTVSANSTANYKIQFYSGPKDQYALAEISPNLDLTIDYGFLWFLAAPIYWLLTRIDSIIGNYGLSIIC